MANLKDIARRIKSVKGTQQITKAMKMVAAAKLRRSQDRILASRPYSDEIKKVVANLAARSGDIYHPLLNKVSQDKPLLLVVVTGDKGLCGSFNSNIVRKSQKIISESRSVDLFLVGKKGYDFFKNKDFKIVKYYDSVFKNVRYEDAQDIGWFLIDSYSKERYRGVTVVYNRFKSLIAQEVIVEELLPVNPTSIGSVTKTSLEYEYEPSASALLRKVLYKYVIFQIYRILLDSQAAEHAARMVAMDAATKNAGEMIDKLTLLYNRVRQASITKEILEVVSGARALEEASR